MTDAEFAALALSLGLSAEPHRHGSSPPFWVLKRGRRELGSYVPLTCSARVGKVMVKVVDVRGLLMMYAELVAVPSQCR